MDDVCLSLSCTGLLTGVGCLPSCVLVPQDCDVAEDQRRQQLSDNAPAHRKPKRWELQKLQISMERRFAARSFLRRYKHAQGVVDS